MNGNLYEIILQFTVNEKSTIYFAIQVTYLKKNKITTTTERSALIDARYNEKMVEWLQNDPTRSIASKM